MISVEVVADWMGVHLTVAVGLHTCTVGGNSLACLEAQMWQMVLVDEVDEGVPVPFG